MEPHATSPQVSELALYGLTHLQEVSLALFSNNALSGPRGLVGLRVLDIRIAVPLTRVKSQFRTFSLDKLIVHSFDLILSGNLIEGWVILCRRLQLVSDHRPALPVQAERSDPLECILDVLKSGEHIDYAFSSAHSLPSCTSPAGERSIFRNLVWRGLTMMDRSAYG